MKDPWNKLLANVKASGNRSKNLSEEDKKTIARYDIRIQAKDLKEVFDNQNGRCYWFNTELNPKNLFIAHHPLAPSVDRLYNDRGYTKDNIVICSRMANLGRGLASPQEFVSIVGEIYSQAWKNPFYLNKLQRQVSERLIEELKGEQ